MFIFDIFDIIFLLTQNDYQFLIWSRSFYIFNVDIYSKLYQDFSLFILKQFVVVNIWIQSICYGKNEYFRCLHCSTLKLLKLFKQLIVFIVITFIILFTSIIISSFNITYIFNISPIKSYVSFFPKTFSVYVFLPFPIMSSNYISFFPKTFSVYVFQPSPIMSSNYASFFPKTSYAYFFQSFSCILFPLKLFFLILTLSFSLIITLFIFILCVFFTIIRYKTFLYFSSILFVNSFVFPLSVVIAFRQNISVRVFFFVIFFVWQCHRKGHHGIQQYQIFCYH